MDLEENMFPNVHFELCVCVCVCVCVCCVLYVLTGAGICDQGLLSSAFCFMIHGLLDIQSSEITILARP